MGREPQSWRAPGQAPARHRQAGQKSAGQNSARWAFAAGGALLAGCAAPVYQGPMPVRNQHPAQLAVLHMAPAAPTVLSAGGFALRSDAAYTSLFLVGQAPARRFTMDGELLRVSQRLRVGLGLGLEAGIELPFAHTSGGFLDNFIIDYHELFGFPDQDRTESLRNNFEVQASRNGGEVWSMDRASFEWLDVPLQLTWQLSESGPDRTGFAVRTAVELPTGDDSRGYGNGELDVAVGMLADWRVGDVALYGHLQHTLAGTPAQSRRADFRFADVTSVGLTAELPLLASVQALAQVEWETSTLRNLGLPATERNQLLLWIGGRWQPHRDWAVEVSFGEDLQGLVSPDFTAWLGFAWTPRPAKTMRR